MSAPASRGRTLLVPGLLLCLGFAAQSHLLGQQSVWVDEAYSLAIARLALPQVIIRTAQADTHPPLYYLLLHGSVSLLGSSEVALRLPSTFFACLGVAVAYPLGRRLGGREIALGAMALLGSSVFLVQFAQEARSYSLLAFGAVLSSYLYLRMCKVPDRRNTIAYVLSGALLLYTHFYGVFVLTAQTLSWLWGWLRSGRPDRGRTAVYWIATQAAIAASFVPWLPAMFGQFHRASDNLVTALERPTLALVLASFVEYTWSAPVTIAVFAILVLGAYRLWRRPGGKQERSNAGYLWLWLLTPQIVPVFISFLLVPFYQARYMIVSLPAFYLLFSSGGRAILRGPWFLGLVAVVVCLQVGALFTYYGATTKEQWRDAVKEVETRACPGDTVFIYADFGRYGYDYYARRTDLQVQSLTKTVTRVSDASLRDFQGKLSALDRLMLVLFQADGSQALTDILANAGFSERSRDLFFRITLLTYERGPAAACPPGPASFRNLTILPGIPR